MNDGTLNTKIVLRNDESADWSDSKVILDKGEIGLEYQENGTVKIKAGNGVDKFSELAYVGSDVKQAQVYQSTVLTSTDEQDDITVIEGMIPAETEVQNGDIAIIKRYITGESGAISHTSYVYEGGVWQAMDGNYSASNVFLKNSLTLAGNYSTIGNYSKGDEIAAGTSIESVLSGLLQQELEPNVTNLPSASISVSGGSAEVGNTFTLPTATLKIDDVGAYPYSPTDTGIVFNAGDVKLSQSGASNSVESAVEMDAGDTITLTAIGDNVTYGDSSVSFTFTGTAKYQAATKNPVTNLGNERPGKAIAAGSCTITNKTATFSGWRKWFKGGDKATDFNSSTIRNLTNSSAAITSHEFELKAADYPGCTRIVIAIPESANKTITSVLLKSASNADITGEFKLKNTAEAPITVEGANGYTAVNYDVWEYKPASLDSSEVYTITIG